MALAIGLLFFAHWSQSQNVEKADSLRKVLNTHTLNDSAKSKIYKDFLVNELNRDTIIKYAQDFLILGKKLSDKRLIHYAYVHLAVAASEKGNLELALEYFYNALDYATNDLDRGVSHSNLGSLYSNNQDYPNALNNYLRAILLFKSIQDSLRLGTTSISLGHCYFRMASLDSAEYYAEFSKNIFNSLDHIYSDYYWAYAEGNLALVKASKGYLEDAESKLMAAIEILSKYGDEFAICDYEFQLAKIYFERGATDDAISKARSSLDRAQKNGFKQFIRDGAEVLSRFYRDLGDYKTAYDYQSQHMAYRDSLMNADLIRKLADQRTEFEVGQKQIEVDLITAEKKIQQIMLLVSIGFSLIVIILAAIIYKFYRDKNKVAKILQLQKAELERVNHTKDKFFSIISHDLRGPVSSFFGISRMIKFLVKEKETDQLLEIADDIDQSVERLSSLLDNLLNWAMQQQGHIPNVPEKLEFKYLAMDLAATFKTLADSKKITVQMEVDETTQIWADRNMTMTIFRNLINNALKFTHEGGKVTLFASEKEGKIVAGVSDTGVGIPNDKLEKLFALGEKKSTYGTSGEKGLGLGLQLVYEFIGLNNGEIKVESEPGNGTTFTVKLPSYKSEMSALLVS